MNGLETFYGPNLSGGHNILNEVWKLAVSKNIVNVLPYPEHPASPYMASLAGRVMLDVRGEAQFATIASQLANLNDNGIRNCSVIIGTWQAYGYDNALPSQYPANASLGGGTEMKTIGVCSKGRLLLLRAPRKLHRLLPGLFRVTLLQRRCRIRTARRRWPG